MVKRLSRNPDARRDLGAPRFLSKGNSTYEARGIVQLKLWGEGVPVHNDIDDECCPDFSCCRGRIYLASQKLRDMFIRDPASRNAMMVMWISELPDEQKILYDLPGQHVFRLETKH